MYTPGALLGAGKVYQPALVYALPRHGENIKHECGVMRQVVKLCDETGIAVTTLKKVLLAN